MTWKIILISILIITVGGVGYKMSHLKIPSDIHSKTTNYRKEGGIFKKNHGSPSTTTTFVKNTCFFNFNCNDNNISTKDICSGSPKSCSNPTITTCLNGDNYCPTGCNYTNDNSCVNTCVEIENNLTSKLDSLAVSTDFSFYLESGDGRNYLYKKGDSNLNVVYESASLSKWVTGTIILRLVDQGYLNLNDHPQDYINNWPITPDDPMYQMTLRDLLSFTSGLNKPTGWSCLDLPGMDFEKCVLFLAKENSGKETIPGAEFYYASYHLQIAGLMAIKARGFNSWQDLYSEFKSQTNLFLNSSYDLPSSSNPRLAGGMHYTGNDYINFLKRYYDGKLLKPSTLKSATTDQVSSSVIKVSPPKTAINEDWHYGLALWLECPSTTYNCKGVDRISSPGAYGAYPFIDYDNNLFGMIVRQGSLGTFNEGYAIYKSVKENVNFWAQCKK